MPGLQLRDHISYHQSALPSPFGALGFVLESRLDLPYPPSVDGASLDTSLSPKLVKAYYEINFVPMDAGPKSSNLPHKGQATLDRSSCPYSKELCRFYFTPSKVSVVQKVEELIAGSKGEVPVVQGLVAGVDQERVFRETNQTVMAKLNRTSHDNDVPVYRGTVRVDEVLRRPEAVTVVQSEDWNSARSLPSLQRCLYGPCSPTRWSGRSLGSVNSRL